MGETVKGDRRDRSAGARLPGDALGQHRDDDGSAITRHRSSHRARRRIGTSTTSATNEPSPAWSMIRPTAAPASKTTLPGQWRTASAPIATEMPRPPAPPRNGDQS